MKYNSFSCRSCWLKVMKIKFILLSICLAFTSIKGCISSDKDIFAKLKGCINPKKKVEATVNAVAVNGKRVINAIGMTSTLNDVMEDMLDKSKEVFDQLVKNREHAEALASGLTDQVQLNIFQCNFTN